MSDLIAAQGDDGYLGPFGPGERMTRTRDRWDPWGHYHCMLALLRWQAHGQDLSALAACRRAADFFCNAFIGTGVRVADAGSPAPNQAVAHVFALLHRATGESRYLQMVREIEVDWASGDGGNYVLGFQRGESFHQSRQPRWESLHAVQALPELFAITGDERYLRAFTQIWWSALAGDRHTSGGFSSLEHAVGNPFDPRPIETCATVAWMCLTVDLLRLTSPKTLAQPTSWSCPRGTRPWDRRARGELGGPTTPRWAASPQEGCRTSICPIRSQALHAAWGNAAPRSSTCDGRNPEAPRLSCCALNGPRGLALLSQWAVMRAVDGVVLNYYGPGQMHTVTPSRQRVLLTQETDYPVGGAVRVTVSPDASERFVLRLRIPGWSSSAEVTVNGQPAGTARPGSYLPLDSRWSPGDVVSVTLDMSPRFVVGSSKPPFATSDGHALGRMAVRRGPLLLAYDPRFDRFDAEALPAIDCNAAPSVVPVPLGAWEPLVLLRFPTLDGRSLTLCDFASAGTTPWIPSRQWQLSRGDGAVLTGPLSLLPDGTIQGSTHPNESRWGFEGTDMTFYGGDGRPTTRFTTLEKPGGRTRLEGPFLPDPAIRHVLRQVDADLTETLWDFVRIDHGPEHDAVVTSPIRFEPFGRIHGYRHPSFPNEVRWQLEGADVVLCNQEGQPTSRLAPSPRLGEVRTFTGSFIPNPRFIHRLQELDENWVRGSVYVSWLPAPVAGPITALSTRPGGTSLFAIGADGQVWNRFFPDARGEWSAWFPHGPNVFPADSAVTALSTVPGGTSLYVLGFDRQVWSRFFPDRDRPGEWSPWFPLGPHVFPAGSRILALSTVSNGTSLYVLGLDGQVWSRFFPDGAHPGQWSPWFPLGPNVFPAGSPIAAVSTRPGGISLFIVGLDAQVWSRFFPDPATSGEWSPWFPLGPNVFPPGAQVAALSTAVGATSLYVNGFDGQIWSRFFPGPRPGEWSDWFALGRPAGR